MNGLAAKNSIGAPLYRLLAATIAIGSFVWTYRCGQRGIYILDQSMVFDAGWRILSGQVPFKDFIEAPTPLAPLIQAFFFLILGVNWFAYIVSAAILDALAALCTMRIMRLLFGDERRDLALAAGLMMGAFFQAVFGTLWYEQVAFFFCLLGILAVCETLLAEGRALRLWQMAAGCCAALAFLGKQNAGAVSFALLAVLVLAAGRPKRADAAKGLFFYGVGASAVAAAFVLWLATYSDIHKFIHYAIESPSARRGSGVYNFNVLFCDNFLWRFGDIAKWSYAVAFCATLLAAGRMTRDKNACAEFSANARLRTAAALAVGAPVAEFLFQATTNNEVENLLFFTALVLSASYGLAWEISPKPLARRLLTITVCLNAAAVLVLGLPSAWHRSVQNAFPPVPTTLTTLNIPPLAELHWIEPTCFKLGYAPVPVEPKDVEGVYAYLTSHNANYVVLGDSSFFYGLTRTVTPQPFITFYPNPFSIQKDIPEMDDWLLESLIKNNVRIVVAEKQSELSSAPFIRTWQWVRDNFKEGPVFGNYHILEHK